MLIISRLLCLCLCVHHALSKDCVLENISRDLNEEIKLQKDILCNYDSYKSPQNTTIVMVSFFLEYFSFDNNEEVFNMDSLICLKWIDERLKWNPNDYGGITETRFSSHHIWRPILKEQKKIAYDDYDVVKISRCQIFSSGDVICGPRVQSMSECGTDLTNWPYDTQSCSFKFGTYNNDKEKVIYTFNSSINNSVSGEEYGIGWDLIHFEKVENASSETQIYLSFVVERRGKCLAAFIIVPSFVLAMLSIISLHLDVDSTRVGFQILSVASHFYFLEVIIENIPARSSTTPSILHYLSVSLMFTLLSVVLTFVLSNLCKRIDVPHRWIIAIKDYAFKGRGKFLIWPRWKVRNLKDATQPDKGSIEVWINFANIVNSVFIVVGVIVYVSIFFTYMPKKTSNY